MKVWREIEVRPHHVNVNVRTGVVKKCMADLLQSVRNGMTRPGASKEGDNPDFS